MEKESVLKQLEWLKNEYKKAMDYTVPFDYLINNIHLGMCNKLNGKRISNKLRADVMWVLHQTLRRKRPHLVVCYNYWFKIVSDYELIRNAKKYAIKPRLDLIEETIKNLKNE